MKTKFIIHRISQLEAMASIRKPQPPTGKTIVSEKGKGSFNRKKLKQQLRKEIE
jgi:hypothetical protein